MQTVLVVDDDASVRDLISVILQVEGFTVLTASSGAEALNLAQGNPVDLVTIDVAMPGMDGWALSRALREQPASSHCRQMMVSGSTETLVGGSADLPAHVDATLSKPFDFTAFTSVLHQLMDLPTQEGAGHPLASLLDEILSERLIVPVFQPVVDLATGEVVGVEALARGPEGPLQMPVALFDVAHQVGRLHELDVLCRVLAIRAARDAAPLTPPLVFVNVEPGIVDLPMSDELRLLLAEPLPFQIVVEFTERALTRRVPALLRHADEIRSRRNAVALDDLGVDPKSVAVLPLVQPEIAKLDMSLLAPTLSDEAVMTAVAVAAYAEHSGAVVIAEGIENEHQRSTAIALGAQWGQGHLLGRPAPMAALAGRTIRRDGSRLATRELVDPTMTPFQLALAAGHEPRRAQGQVVLGVSRHLELQAHKIGDVGVAMVALQARSNLVGPSAAVYADIARQGAVVGFLGRGIPAEPLLGAYGVDLAEDDPLCDEWVIAVLGPHHAGTLCARDLGDPGSRDERRYEFVLSHDRALAAGVARLLARRLTPRKVAARTSALGALAFTP